MPPNLQSLHVTSEQVRANHARFTAQLTPGAVSYSGMKGYIRDGLVTFGTNAALQK